jgi:hypothetical protein
MSQHLPHCPPEIPSDEWLYILERDKRECACARYECRQAGNVGYCCDELEIDHKQPRAWGGDDSFANLRLLCKNGSSFANRNRLNEPSPYWAAANIWDEPLHPEKLRHIQRLAAYDEIERLAAAIKANDQDAERARFRNRLLRVITFIAGTTGIGKTILMLSSFKAFNNVIGRNYPRVRHVLWFEPETGLRDSIKAEIKKDVDALEIFDRSPTVNIAKGFDDLLKGPDGADVTVACPHSLWKIERSHHVRSDNEKRDVLAQWDTGVFDEVDWADHQNQHIASLWTNALKFSISAVCPFF